AVPAHPLRCARAAGHDARRIRAARTADRRRAEAGPLTPSARSRCGWPGRVRGWAERQGAGGAMTSDTEMVADRPLSGEPVVPLPTGLLPARQPLEGTSARLEPIDPARHAAELYEASHGVAGGEALWRFLGYGPWADAGVFQAWLRDCAAAHDP